MTDSYRLLVAGLSGGGLLIAELPDGGLPGAGRPVDPDAFGTAQA